MSSGKEETRNFLISLGESSYVVWGVKFVSIIEIILSAWFGRIFPWTNQSNFVFVKRFCTKNKNSEGIVFFVVISCSIVSHIFILDSMLAWGMINRLSSLIYDCISTLASFWLLKCLIISWSFAVIFGRMFEIFEKSSFTVFIFAISIRT